MKITTVAMVALSLAFLAACDRGQPRPATSGASGSSAAPQPQSQTTPASAGTPSATEKKEGSNPVQGQVDPNEPAQHKDFQRK
jgi:hypothetical protein